eukprot:Lithocolla_globosa_v1_NODE_2195_length_2116_cov_31.512858.p1 type:complete len:667 gc:universal NODE_2195_length_2116_cov_31.512858:105-2105(+)
MFWLIHVTSLGAAKFPFWVVVGMGSVTVEDVARFDAEYETVKNEVVNAQLRASDGPIEIKVNDKVVFVVQAQAETCTVLFGKREMLIFHALEEHELNKQFVDDFLLSFRVYITPMELWKFFLAIFELEKSRSQGIKPNDVRLTICAIIRMWICRHAIDFLASEDLQEEVRKFFNVLEAAELLEQHDEILMAFHSMGLSSKGRRNKYKSAAAFKQAQQNAAEDKRKSVLSKKFGDGLAEKDDTDTQSLDSTASSSNFDEKSFIQPFLSLEETVMVFRENAIYKGCRLNEHITAGELLASALSKFELTEGKSYNPADYQLCEVKLNGTIINFKNDVVSLKARLSANGRFYIKRIETEATPWELSSLESLHIREELKNFKSEILNMYTEQIANLLTNWDHNLYRRIDPLEYLTDVLKVRGQSVSNFLNFSNRFSRMTFWVTTEILLNEKLEKRVKFVKKFIEIAQTLYELNNFNTCFGILSGLQHSAIDRLKSTWKKVPNSHIECLDSLKSLMDPSRNMKTYRSLIENATPPLIPFFPVIVKDLFVIHDSNPSFKGEDDENRLVNFEKLTMINKAVLIADTYRYERYPDLLTPMSKDTLKRQQSMKGLKRNESSHSLVTSAVASIKKFEHPDNPIGEDAINQYISTLPIIDDDALLTKISKEIEPPEQS